MASSSSIPWCLAIIAICAVLFQSTDAGFLLESACPGNLIQNGGFELYNTFEKPTDFYQKEYSNKYWAWYHYFIPGWYTVRPDGQPCVKVDWQKTYIEVARGALATAPEGAQYGELLPNGTGNYCQDLQLVKGQQYRLSYYYGRLVTNTEGQGRGTHGKGALTAFETAVDVAIRPSHEPTIKEPTAAGGRGSWQQLTWPKEKQWPQDKQGFTIISQADTEKQWAAQQKQWVKYETTFTATSNKTTLAFINAKRPKICGSCGSLLDAVCLQKV